MHPSRVIGLFPTPLLHARAALDAPSAAALATRFAGQARQDNVHTPRLSHTTILDPQSDAQLAAVVERVAPRLVEFGELMFGQRLDWQLKELWFNVLAPGGHQALHNHANSFVSGVIYLSAVPAGSSTVFVKPLGQPGAVFANTHAGTATGPFNGERWVMPEVGPGDLVLFPSHLLHEVPENRGAQRISLAFNAIPRRLDAWGYTIGFTA